MNEGHSPHRPHDPAQCQSASQNNDLYSERIPLVSALAHCARRQNVAFYTPGHKRGQGITSVQRQLFGQAVFQADLPELPELDNLFAPAGVIAQAQTLAAQLFGANQTWFLANGSTCGIEAALLCVSQPGAKVLVPRNAHISVISGLVLSGAIPIYMTPQYSQRWDIPLDITPEAIAQALSAHPDITAVVLVSPTYHGICSDVEAIAQITHRHNIPLIVDEAHGPHFAFHPKLPTPALAAGADIAVQSTHKVLSAFTQAAMLHVQGSRIDRNRLSQALQLTQSTSPSYLLLGSLDAARHQMDVAGDVLMEQSIALADWATQEINDLEGLSVLQPKWPSKGTTEEWSEQAYRGDRTRITVNVSRLGITGFQADEQLHQQYGITAELPANQTLTFIISLGNTAQDISQLIDGFRQLTQQPLSSATKQLSGSLASNTQLPHITQGALTPRQAFFAPKCPLPCKQAIGQICAETICPYPPGIPVLFPGEIITAEAIAQLQITLSAGGLITGCQDPTLQTILTINR